MGGLKMKYFVLKPEGASPHSAASRAAMMEYAKQIEKHNLLLARQLRDWVDREGTIENTSQFCDGEYYGPSLQK